MQLVIKPTDNIFDTVTVDIYDIRKMYLSENGLIIELNDLFNHIRVIKIDALLSEYEMEIEE